MIYSEFFSIPPPPQKILYDKMFSHFAASSAGAGDTKMKSSMDFWLSPWTTTESDQDKDKRLFDRNSPNIMIYIFSNIESDALNYHTHIHMNYTSRLALLGAGKTFQSMSFKYKNVVVIIKHTRRDLSKPKR